MTTPGLAMSELASAAPLALASLRLGPLQFDSPVWLVLIPVLGALTVLMSFSRSLSGLGSVTRWVALGARLLVILLLVSSMAEPQLRREAKDVATTVVLDASESVPQAAQQSVEEYVRRACRTRSGPTTAWGL